MNYFDNCWIEIVIFFFLKDLIKNNVLSHTNKYKSSWFLITCDIETLFIFSDN